MKRTIIGVDTVSTRGDMFDLDRALTSRPETFVVSPLTTRHRPIGLRELGRLLPGVEVSLGKGCNIHGCSCFSNQRDDVETNSRSSTMSRPDYRTGTMCVIFPTKTHHRASSRFCRLSAIGLASRPINPSYRSNFFSDSFAWLTIFSIVLHGCRVKDERTAFSDTTTVHDSDRWCHSVAG
jgi:hypothetical protein